MFRIYFVVNNTIIKQEYEWHMSLRKLIPKYSNCCINYMSRILSKYPHNDKIREKLRYILNYGYVSSDTRKITDENILFEICECIALAKKLGIDIEFLNINNINKIKYDLLSYNFIYYNFIKINYQEEEYIEIIDKIDYFKNVKFNLGMFPNKTNFGIYDNNKAVLKLLKLYTAIYDLDDGNLLEILEEIQRRSNANVLYHYVKILYYIKKQDLICLFEYLVIMIQKYIYYLSKNLIKNVDEFLCKKFNYSKHNCAQFWKILNIISSKSNYKYVLNYLISINNCKMCNNVKDVLLNILTKYLNYEYNIYKIKCYYEPIYLLWRFDYVLPQEPLYRIFREFNLENILCHDDVDHEIKVNEFIFGVYKKLFLMLINNK
ncbi:hypothetical protein Hokovirus_1_351 [Hokovirus HKV1]|uniref:Uncharacterized protein n=1 Tax=Hokovirus HKV1 TaxID=1977638 RepID=A0A1V0SFI0_9VIRU|nr:hypothetical protein Hokovirus_1_351 [Hokovirus HKV1]